MLPEWKIQSELAFSGSRPSGRVLCSASTLGTAPSEEAENIGTHFLLDIFEAHLEALNYNLHGHALGSVSPLSS
ncbi:hypothetical protein E4U13_005897, partial [Claviceps humidiphila]